MDFKLEGGMMNQKPDDQRPFDPFTAWQNMRDASVDAWAKVMIQMVNSEEYARATSTMLDAYLTTSSPLRKLIEAMMVQFVTSEAYSRLTREMLDSYLATSAPFREALQTTMLQALTQFSAVPAADLAGMMERLDPTGMWRNMRDASFAAWSSMMTSPLQATIATSMTQALTQLNMPTRTDVTSLSERLNHIDMRLDEIEAKLAAGERPRRATRRRSESAEGQ